MNKAELEKDNQHPRDRPGNQGATKTPGESIKSSADRLAQGEEEWRRTGDPLWKEFLKRESGYLLRRAFKFWWRIRFGRWKMP